MAMDLCTFGPRKCLPSIVLRLHLIDLPLSPHFISQSPVFDLVSRSVQKSDEDWYAPGEKTTSAGFKLLTL